MPNPLIPSHAEARDIVARFMASHFEDGTKERARITIPADPRRDDDIRIGAFIDASERLFQRLELLVEANADLGQIDPATKQTYYEGSPTKDGTTHLLWVELNDALKEAKAAAFPFRTDAVR